MARAMLVASAALLLGLLGPAEATHFRYGSIKWEPTAATAADTTLAAALTPTSTWSVNFYVSMAFRRNYFWGAYFNEAWRENRQAVWKSTTAVEEGFNCSTQNPVLVQVRGCDHPTPPLRGKPSLPRRGARLTPPSPRTNERSASSTRTSAMRTPARAAPTAATSCASPRA